MDEVLVGFPSKSLANSVCEDIFLSKLSGVAQVDKIMEELAGIEEKRKCIVEKGLK
ncbi:hypothetical protein KIN20_014117 [Parelaphostrongylus tenuis]|uniref:Uncharacterized protein n=1 Tax=Parelaphostrongylus tenuis TaxID=148309 RepID=A0AAD5MWX9_PARTN|nr:hypothetical protein KIN20_014117 [Parelaphostrongylus tenuis]